jgi:hypothetical protein
MTVSRVLCLVALAAVVSVPAANAQFGGTPGVPGTGGLGSPLACQLLLALRVETLKNATSIRAVNDEARAQHRPSRKPKVMCALAG